MNDRAAKISFVPRRSASTHSELLDNEASVYEWTRREVHALNPTAARVWQMCDGRTSAGEMAGRLRAEFDVAHADELVWLALAEFEQKQLIEPGLSCSSEQTMLSRRALIARLGLTAAMLPIVTSVIAPTALQAQSLQSQTFNFTGAPGAFLVPAGVTSVMIDAYGGRGGLEALAFGPAGAGARVQATLTVTAGESLTVTVGGSGGDYLGSGVGEAGFNGGGAGGALAGGGGGASDVRRGGTLLVVAGGAGGTGNHNNPVPPTGAGGGLTGQDGAAGGIFGPGGGGGGGGGTQSQGGAGGAAGTSGLAGANGALGIGGAGGGTSEPADNTFGGGGGGGGGYYGGGGGGGQRDGATRQGGVGGGGSSYTDPGATSVIHTRGGASGMGPGKVIISW